MDNRLIFLYKGAVVTTWGLTKWEQLSLAMKLPDLSTKAVLIGKSVRTFNRGVEKV